MQENRKELEQESLGEKKFDWRDISLILPPAIAYITWDIYPSWWAIPAVGCLLLAAHDYRLLWKYPSSDDLPAGDLEAFLRWYNRWLRLGGGFFLNSLVGIFLLLANVGGAFVRHWLHYENQAILLIASAGVGLLIPFTFLGIFKWKRQDLYADDRPTEVKEAFRDAARGWGMTAQEAWRQGRSEGSVVVILGCFSIAASAIGAPHFFPPSKLEDFGFFLLFVGLAALGVGLFYYFFRVPWHLIQYWRQWRNQPEERLIIQGKIVGFWLDEGDGYTAIIKVQRSNGISKLLFVNADLVPDDENAEVRIEYLYGTEAVVSVEALTPDEEENEAEEAP